MSAQRLEDWAKSFRPPPCVMRFARSVSRAASPNYSQAASARRPRPFSDHHHTLPLTNPSTSAPGTTMPASAVALTVDAVKALSSNVASSDVFIMPNKMRHQDHRDPSNNPPRLSQFSLFLVALVLLFVAEFTIPGGLTPRRKKQEILRKRVEEQLDLLSEDDPNEILPGGPLSIDDIHRNGRVHRGVWIFALDSHLRLLLAWRAPMMRTCPMTWSTIGEHVVANESFQDAASRGLFEEARFIARPRTYTVGFPFFFHYIYSSQNSTPTLMDNQWTQAYVILPRGDALDFRALDDREAEAAQADGENSRYQGMPLPEVVRHAIQRPNFFCNHMKARWILRVVPLVVRVLKMHEKRLFRGHLRDDWAELVRSGSPVCCAESEHAVPLEQVNISRCGIPCEEHTIDPSDADVLT